MGQDATQHGKSDGGQRISREEKRARKLAARRAWHAQRPPREPAPKNNGNGGANKGKKYQTFGAALLAAPHSAPQQPMNRPFSTTELALFKELEKAKGT